MSVANRRGHDRLTPNLDTPVLVNRPLRPGADLENLSRFGDDRWELSAAVFEMHYPNISLGFDACPDPFVDLAKLYVWTLLNTEEPVALRRGGGTARLSILTVSTICHRLFAFFEFLTVRRIEQLSRVTSEDLEAYLAQVKEAEISLSKQEDLLTEVRRLWSYRAQLPAEQALPNDPPWDGDDTQDLLGRRPGMGENATPRIPEEVMQPLLLWSLRYVEDFSHDIINAWQEYLNLVRRNVARKRRGESNYSTRRSGELLREIPTYLEQLAGRGDGLPGCLDEDDTLCVDWPQLARVLGCSERSLSKGSISRGLIDASALPIELGLLLTSPITGTLDGQPWLSRRINYLDAARHARRLSTACFIVIAYLSGMRLGEVLSLLRECSTYDEAANLWLVYGTTWKNAKDENGSKVAQGEIRADPWVVISPVSKAIAALEQLHTRQLLFPAHIDDGRRSVKRALATRSSGSIRDDLLEFHTHINAYCDERGRSDAIPTSDSHPLSGNRFRRTLAWSIYRRPRGLVAGAIQFGHMSTLMFLGYAGTYASGFRDEAAVEGFLLRLEELADDVGRLDAGEHVSGPAAASYIERVRAGNDRFAGRTLHSSVAARALQTNPALQVFHGQGMTCVFDATKALCLVETRSDALPTPALDDCRSKCGNIARTDMDIQTVSADIVKLRLLVDDPLSPPIRHRREQALLVELERFVAQHTRGRDATQSEDLDD